MTREEWEDVLFDSVKDEVTQDILNNYVLDLEAENDELRKLAHILVHCMSSSTECDDCMLNGARGVTLPIDPLFACDGLYDMLSEMGIGVDGK